MPREQAGFLPDLTSSEGQLPRYTAIVHLLDSAGPSDSAKLDRLIQQRLGLTNAKVISRHLRVAQSFGILVRDGGAYRVGSEGRALSALTRRDAPGGRMLTAEKLFYWRAFCTYIPVQLTAAFGALSLAPHEAHERQASHYGVGLIRAGAQWGERQRTHDLRERLERDPEQPPRKVANNYKCVTLWLRQLGLASAKGELTPEGRKLASTLAHEAPANLSAKAYSLGSVFVCGRPMYLPAINVSDPETPVKQLEPIVQEAYRAFERPELRISDARAMRIYVCIETMVRRGQILDEPMFDALVHRLADQGFIHSLMTGRDGKLAHVSLSLNAGTRTRER